MKYKICKNLEKLLENKKDPYDSLKKIFEIFTQIYDTNLFGDFESELIKEFNNGVSNSLYINIKTLQLLLKENQIDNISISCIVRSMLERVLIHTLILNHYDSIEKKEIGIKLWYLNSEKNFHSIFNFEILEKEENKLNPEEIEGRDTIQKRLDTNESKLKVLLEKIDSIFKRTKSNIKNKPIDEIINNKISKNFLIINFDATEEKGLIIHNLYDLLNLLKLKEYFNNPYKLLSFLAHPNHGMYLNNHNDTNNNSLTKIIEATLLIFGIYFSNILNTFTTEESKQAFCELF